MNLVFISVFMIDAFKCAIGGVSDDDNQTRPAPVDQEEQYEATTSESNGMTRPTDHEKDTTTFPIPDEFYQIKQKYEQTAHKIFEKFNREFVKFEKGVSESLRSHPHVQLLVKFCGEKIFNLKNNLNQDSILRLFLRFGIEKGSKTGSQSNELLNMLYIIIFSKNFIPFLNECSYRNKDSTLKLIFTILNAYDMISDYDMPWDVISEPMKHLQKSISSYFEEYDENNQDDGPLIITTLLREFSRNSVFTDLFSFQGHNFNFENQTQLYNDRWVIIPTYKDIINLENEKGKLNPLQTKDATSMPMFLILSKESEENSTSLYDYIFVCGKEYKILAIYTLQDGYLESYYPNNRDDPLSGSWFKWDDTVQNGQMKKTEVVPMEDTPLMIVYELLSLN